MDSRKLSPPAEALLEGLELVAEMERWTPLCDGDTPVPAPPVVPPVEPPPPTIFLKDSELPDREPSLSS